MDLKLRGRTALVTGGSVGLGRAICRVLAAEGAAVGVNYRSHAAEAESLAHELTASHGVRTVAVGADVAEEGEVAAMFQAAVARLGPLDILVNNAAVCPTGPAQDFTAAEWNETVQVNLTGTFLCCREMIRMLTSAGRSGRIVNVSSAAAFLGSTSGHAPYDASKGGIVSLTVSLAREVSRHGIAVNAVAPGMMRTDMTAQALDASLEKYVARIPLGRIGDSAEVARVVAFLASEAASYMTGATVDVSGGMLMR
jgi:3-oxoacyl-[acyl-carrier protein] reductase